MGYSGYPQLQNPRIRPAGKSPCEVARELRDQAPPPKKKAVRSEAASGYDTSAKLHRGSRRA